MTLKLAGLVLLLAFGCGDVPDRPTVELERGFLGEWVSVGDGLGVEARLKFLADGRAVISIAGTTDEHGKYRVEVFKAWSQRRSKEINADPEDIDMPGDERTLFMVTVYDPANPNEFNPSRNFLYNAKDDTLSLLLIAEFRRVK
ncbi:MAG: hypothetical protein M3R13_05835 [Armatimonadota bacterium]|nr:hypothetical protein [Armatimonadota bacterium]